MTVANALLPSQVAEPSTREGVVRLGMPQLALGGLSESWLLKELGDRHWRLIAEAAGLDEPRFRDIDGAPVYPAFSGTSIEAAHFDLPDEHDDLVIASELARVSATQFASRHHFTCRGTAVGTVSLSSVFVKRTRSGHNRALARIAPEILSRLPVRHGFAAITALASGVRAGTWSSHFGFGPQPGEVTAREKFRPCPAQDFNGAGFLYFPSFPAFVDRAEWMLFGAAGPILARDVVYHGNIDVGETVIVEVRGRRVTQDERAHWCSLVASDGRRLADVFTRKGVPHQ